MCHTCPEVLNNNLRNGIYQNFFQCFQCPDRSDLRNMLPGYQMIETFDRPCRKLDEKEKGKKNKNYDGNSLTFCVARKALSKNKIKER